MNYYFKFQICVCAWCMWCLYLSCSRSRSRSRGRSRFGVVLCANFSAESMHERNNGTCMFLYWCSTAPTYFQPHPSSPKHGFIFLKLVLVLPIVYKYFIAFTFFVFIADTEAQQYVLHNPYGLTLFTTFYLSLSFLLSFSLSYSPSLFLSFSRSCTHIKNK